MSGAPAAAGTAAVEDRRAQFGWRRLQIAAAVMAVAALLVPMILAGKIEAFLVGMAAPFVVGLVLSRWLPRTGAVFLGVVSLGILLSSAPFLIGALVHPEAMVDFVSTWVLTIATIVGVVAAVPSYRERARSATATPRRVGMAAALLALVLTGVSVVAAAGVEDADAQPGDIAIRTENFAFAPTVISAGAGTVSVHITNADSTRHTFTIDGVADISVAPESAQRASFDVAPGSYRYFCKPHAADMAGELIVK